MTQYRTGPVGINPLLELAKTAMTPPSPAPSFQWGTVSALSPLTVALDGTGATYQPSAVVPALAVGDRVLLVTQNRRMIVLGKGYPDQ